MPICIECRYPVHQLYTTYSKADDRALGKGVRLTQCPHCKRFADKYVEHDRVILFIDLVLVKPQVYRHLLFNRLGTEDDKFDLSVVRFGILLLLFDVYLTWARIEKTYPQALQDFDDGFSPFPIPSGTETPSILTTQHLFTQYLFFLVFCAVTTFAFHLPIRLLCTIPFKRLSVLSQPYPQANRISTALLVSSCTKLLPILMVVWDYDLPSSASAVSWAVIVNNVAALEILLDCGYVRATGLVAVGAAARAAVGYFVLGLVGLDGARIVSGGMNQGEQQERLLGGMFGLL